nr:14256_t:CDS:2 [Entrophospora candida]
MTQKSNQYKKYFHVLPDKPDGYNHLGICIAYEEEWLNWVADNDTETTIENELYNNGEGFIDTSSKEINNLQNLSAPNKKRLGKSNVKKYSLYLSHSIKGDDGSYNHSPIDLLDWTAWTGPIRKNNGKINQETEIFENEEKENNYLHQQQTLQNFSPMTTSTTPIPTTSNQLYQQNPNLNNILQSSQQHPTQENNYLHQQQTHQNFSPTSMSTSRSTTPIPTTSNQLYQQNPTFNNNLQANQKHTT